MRWALVEAGHDCAGPPDHLDLFAGRARGRREVLDVDQDQMPSAFLGFACSSWRNLHVHTYTSSSHVHITRVFPGGAERLSALVHRQASPLD